MKKLLFVPLFGLLAWLGSCNYSAIVPPTPSEIVKQAHDAFPSVPALPTITVPDVKPKPKAHHARPAHPRPVAPPVEYVVPDEPAAPYAPLECIWPLRLIPGCVPQESGRQP